MATFSGLMGGDEFGQRIISRETLQYMGFKAAALQGGDITLFEAARFEGEAGLKKMLTRWRKEAARIDSRMTRMGKRNESFDWATTTRERAEARAYASNLAYLLKAVYGD